jgi:hypothetical protein
MKVLLVCKVCNADLEEDAYIKFPKTPNPKSKFVLAVPLCPFCSARLTTAAHAEGYLDAMESR